MLRARAAWSRARWDRPFQPVALRSAARAAIVIPAVFAVADKVIAKPDTSLTAAFGSFAMLVLVEFAGPTRQRLAAYGGLALVGAVFITFGTLCSRDPWLAAGGMALVGFVTLFAGVFGGYVAAGSAAAILTFVLPVTLPAPNSAIPDRLEGWGLAVAAGITAVLLLWPNRRRESLNRDVAGALRAVADLVESDRDVSERAREAEEAVRGLGRRFLGSQHRPVGAAAATAALASFPDELNWLLSFLEPRSGRPPLAIACVEDAEALAAIGAVLRSSAARIETGAGEIDLARLDSARLAVAQAVMGRLAELPADLDEAALMSSLEQPFRIRVAAYSARQLADYALLATGGDVPEHDTRSPAGRTAAHSTLERTEELALTHARADSVWFQNSVRAAVGLAVAVYIAQRTGLQHGFWVVLGTLSVLRSNALGTGWSILSALGGTAAGLVAGALLVVGIGTHEAVLWGVLPVALLLAAYAPRAISFAAGQAGFTVVLFILFNIVQPVGWRVGIVRIEDVAIGFAISLGVGLLFWPRGAAARLRRDLGAAYESAVELVIATAHELGDDRGAAETAATMEREADAAIHRLDDAFRQYVSERTATRWDVEDVAALVGGASRVRRAALSVSSLAAMVDSGHRLGRCARNLDGELLGLQSWFITLAYAITNERTIPPPHLRDREGQAQLLACIREATRSRDPATVKSAAVLLWTSQHLDDLWRLEAHIAARQLDGSAPPVAANV